MYADAMGLPVQVMEQKDAALYGGCLLGALGIGMIQDLSEIRYPVKTVFEPREEETRKYAVLAERYQRYIGLLTPLCAEVKEPL
jgi:sugar (pentulose or hexulose) kinase